MPMILDSPSSPPSADLDSRRERRQVHHEADAVVVGAGILGCAIATTLARQGRSVVLLEKSLKEPDRIVGELLQPGGVAALEKLGLRGRGTWKLHFDKCPCSDPIMQIAWKVSMPSKSTATRSYTMAKVSLSIILKTRPPSRNLRGDLFITDASFRGYGRRP